MRSSRSALGYRSRLPPTCEHKRQQRESDRCSARARRDRGVREVIRRVSEENCGMVRRSEPGAATQPSRNHGGPCQSEERNADSLLTPGEHHNILHLASVGGPQGSVVGSPEFAGSQPHIDSPTEWLHTKCGAEEIGADSSMPSIPVRKRMYEYESMMETHADFRRVRTFHAPPKRQHPAPTVVQPQLCRQVLSRCWSPVALY